MCIACTISIPVIPRTCFKIADFYAMKKSKLPKIAEFLLANFVENKIQRDSKNAFKLNFPGIFFVY